MKAVLTIAGSDPSGGAGLQADLKTFKAMGVYGLGIPSVLTAQNTGGVVSIHELSEDFIALQMDTLLGDIRPDAVKTGMLYTEYIIRTAGDKIREFSLSNLVVDPVAVSSTGVLLVEEKAMEAVKNSLFPISRVITPNIYEASVLTGIGTEDMQGMKDAAVRLKEYGAGAVIITGGHLPDKAVDLLFDGHDFITLENEKLDGEYHGTGCVFSSVIASCLALDYGVKEAFIKAKEFVWSAMKNAVSVGRGMKILNV
jgi:hydroxymethylpyrimidine/phosphomethylpyrimidine kinase